MDLVVGRGGGTYWEERRERNRGGDVVNERRVKEKRESRKVVFKPRCTIF